MISRILPFLTVLVAVGVFFGYINPTYTGPVAELRDRIHDYDQALAAAAEFKEREAQLLAERNNIPEEGIKRVEAFLPDGVDNVQLILDLNTLANRSGLKITNVAVSMAATPNTTPGSIGNAGTALPLTTNTSPVESINMTMSATGSYTAFRTFLLGVERSLRPLDLVHLSLKDSDTGVYTYEMAFRIYWLP
ncbi:MAG: putative pilO [Parcubacteria bacterium C7867-001]|nr:MAG: putative pilO [Parcubacteria bacterium C7867-001]